MSAARMIEQNPVVAAAAVAGVLVALWIAARGAQGAGQDVGAAAVDFAGGVLSGGVIALGETVGIPKTNQTQCQKDLAAGNNWAASFSCPAADFIKGVTGW